MSISEELISDITTFLKETLVSEELSSTANQRRLALLQRLTSKCNPPFPYVDMNGSQKSAGDADSQGECYEELESTSVWSGSGCSSNKSSRNSRSNTLPTASKHHKERFSLFFPGVTDSNTRNRELLDNYADINDCSDDLSKRNSILSISDNSLSPSSVKSDESSEVVSISASAIRYSAVKCGQLSRKEKLLFVDHMKRYWVALLGTTLYIYCNEKDLKPVSSINVDEYKARPITTGPASKRDCGFEIVCPGLKTHQFYSSSPSEMESWISCINQSLPLPQTYTQPSYTESVTSDDSESKVDGLERRSLRADNMEKINRELPSIPVFLNYDTPDPVCRPVSTFKPVMPFDKISEFFQETLYNSIDDESLAEQLARYDYPVRQDPVIENIENTDSSNETDNVYYNLLTKIKEESEKYKESCPVDVDNVATETNIVENSQKNGISRIRQIIQRIEEINKQNTTINRKSVSYTTETKLLNPTSKPTTNEDVYELVKSPTYVNINA